MLLPHNAVMGSTKCVDSTKCQLMLCFEVCCDPGARSSCGSGRGQQRVPRNNLATAQCSNHEPSGTFVCGPQM